MQEDVIIHGEAMVISVRMLPDNVKKIATKGEYKIIAPSETTGNHHVVDLVESCEFYEDENGTLFFKTEEPTQVKCVIADRHDAIKIEPGIYEIGIQQEYDPFEQRSRNVAD